ncbi:MAG: sodium-dependent phosphate cotransporter [Candidatus Latescibacterota bacterium]|jgi:sodium-dependent phosphate cotransporter
MQSEEWKTLLRVVFLVGILYAFLVSIGLMGEAFKIFGKGVANQLMTMTANPLVGLFTGILATTLVQSSSTTTSITVGLLAAGSLTIEGAIPIIMGANIGTSVTNTLVSMGHITRPEEFKRALAGATVHDFFNLIAVLVLFPIEMAFGYLRHVATFIEHGFEGVGGLKFASPLKLVTKPAITFLSDSLGQQPWLVLIVSLVMMFLALRYLVVLAKSLVISRAERVLNKYMFGGVLQSMAFGVVLTIMVQSSSITTSLIIPLVGAGILTLEQIFPYTLGANVGTTVTALLAAFSTGNPAACTVAFAHLFFNLSGIALVYPIRQIRNIPLRMARALAELTSQARGLAIVYLILVFYVIPGVIVFVWR